MDVHEMRKKKSLKPHLEMKPCSKREYIGINVKVGKKKKKDLKDKWVGKKWNEQNKWEDVLLEGDKLKG